MELDSGRHHWGVLADRHGRGLHGQLKRIPAPIRLAVLLAWFGVAVFAKWEGVNKHDTSPAVWAILLAGLVVVGALGLFQFLESFDADDRAPFDGLSIGWQGFFVFTGALLVLGPIAVFDGDPSTDPFVGGVMFLVGVILVAMLVRHLAKPVRPEPEQLRVQQPDGTGRTDNNTPPWYVSDGDDRPADRS